MSRLVAMVLLWLNYWCNTFAINISTFATIDRWITNNQVNSSFKLKSMGDCSDTWMTSICLIICGEFVYWRSVMISQIYVLLQVELTNTLQSAFTNGITVTSVILLRFWTLPRVTIESNFRFSNLASVLLQRQPDHCDRLVVRRVTRHSWVTQSRRIRSSDACQFLLSRPQLMMINC